MKLKYHRLKPGGVLCEKQFELAMKLKNHRLKPGGVLCEKQFELAMKLKNHRLKPGGVHVSRCQVVAMKFKNHRLKPGGVQSEILNLKNHLTGLSLDSRFSLRLRLSFNWIPSSRTTI